MRISLLACLVFLFAPTAGATLVQFDFSGTVAGLGFGLSNAFFDVGSAVSGSMVWDTASPQSPGPTNYPGSITSFSLTLGSYTATGGGATTAVNLVDDGAIAGCGLCDRILMADLNPTGAAIGGSPLISMRTGFLSTNLTSLASGALPTSMGFLPSEGWQNRIDFNPGFASFSISSYTLTVPEPGIPLLLASMGIGVALRARWL